MPDYIPSTAEWVRNQVELYERTNGAKGNTLRELERLEEAVACFDQALAIRPDFAEACLNRGLTLMALIGISMDKHTPERFQSLEAVIRDIPEVLECLLITGQQADYQLKVVVRDMDAYQHLLLNQITRIEGVTGVHTSFVLRRVVDRTAVPV